MVEPVDLIILKVQKIRKKNLKKLIGDRTIAAFCSQYHQIDPTYVSQLLNGHRNFGEKAARNMEVKAGIEIGSLDNESRQSWPFNSMSYHEYQQLQAEDKIEVEALLALKALIVRAQET